MITKFLQPATHILIGLMLGDIIYQQGSDSTAIVCRGDGTVTLLSS